MGVRGRLQIGIGIGIESCFEGEDSGSEEAGKSIPKAGAASSVVVAVAVNLSLLTTATQVFYLTATALRG